MKRSSGRSDPPAELSPFLSQQLNCYALAAGATAAGLIASAQPCEAKIIYTKTHYVVTSNSIHPVDLNHDGIIDFLLQEFGRPGSSSGANTLWFKEALGNGVVGSQKGIARYAAALKKGSLVGPSQAFVNNSLSYGEVMLRAGCSTFTCIASGKWINIADGYIGLELQIKGQTHYGWARMSVHNKKHTISAVLTGYAYETTPNKGILAGATPEDSTHAGVSAAGAARVPAGSLGELALGPLSSVVPRQP